ncbi:hypothetical protein FB192DRAFT_1404874 [Mucor lusitanicus]|uniref:Uncharacterized protein n=1 Tax=Mucor circinelloides f. lusitanicus TaxID=29924 RepID=A0A8H4B6S8_MUCCL|nr:hypothetical protein FB192DRAFT_1404874 [Mucor lusitanicus]
MGLAPWITFVVWIPNSGPTFGMFVKGGLIRSGWHKGHQGQTAKWKWGGAIGGMRGQSGGELTRYEPYPSIV